MRGEEEHRLDQFQFHQTELSVVDHAIDTSIERWRNRLHDASCRLKDIRKWIGSLIGPSEITLHPEVARFGLLENSVAELPAEKDQRPLAFFHDAVHEFLHHHSGTAAKLVKQILQGIRVLRCNQVRAMRSRGDAGLDHRFCPAQVIAVFPASGPDRPPPAKSWEQSECL